MKSSNNQKGFALIHALLLLVIAGLIGFAGWRVYSSQQAINKSLDSTTNNLDSLSKKDDSASTIPDDYTEYKSQEYDFRFIYPKSYGDVSLKKEDGSIKGHSLSLSFAKQPKLKAGLLSADYEEHGRDGTCYVLLGIFPQTSLSDIKQNVNEGDTTPESGYKTTTDILKDTEDTLIYENFEAGEQTEGLGGCYGLWTNGYKAFKDTAKHKGIQFFWDGTESNDVPLSDFDKYKANPNNYFSEADRQAFITTVSSANSL